MLDENKDPFFKIGKELIDIGNNEYIVIKTPEREEIEITNDDWIFYKKGELK